MSEALAVSTDLLLEPPCDTRCRFLEDWSASSNGLGRVEQGSEETARSRDSSAGSWSIWQRTNATVGAGALGKLLCGAKLKSFTFPQSMACGEVAVFTSEERVVVNRQGLEARRHRVPGHCSLLMSRRKKRQTDSRRSQK